jgi:hypothetical protein
MPPSFPSSAKGVVRMLGQISRSIIPGSALPLASTKKNSRHHKMTDRFLLAGEVITGRQKFVDL